MKQKHNMVVLHRILTLYIKFESKYLTYYVFIGNKHAFSLTNDIKLYIENLDLNVKLIFIEKILKNLNLK